MSNVISKTNPLPVSPSSEVLQVIPDFKTPAEFQTAYGNFADVNWAGGDFVSLTRSANGQQIVALSCSPLAAGESRIVIDKTAQIPCALDVEASLIRNRQQFATMTLFSDGADNAGLPVTTPFDIVSISQSTADYSAAYTGTAGTILTVVLNTALILPGLPGGVFIGDWCHVTGLVDTRLNYQNLCVRWISDDRKTVTFGFSDEAALPSLAVPVISPVLGSAKLHVYQDFNGADAAAGYRFTGTSSTSAALIGIFGGDAGSDKRISGTLIGDHRVTIGNTAPAYVASGNAGGFELKANSRFRIEARPGEVAFLDKTVDNIGAQYSARAAFSAVKPGTDDKLKPRFRIYQPPGMSRPVAKIGSIAKSGSTTATVVTKSAHGLVTGNYVTIKGVRDQANFAAFSTPVAVTVIDATTFTCVVGSAVTATSQGGSVHLINGGADQPGIIGQAVQSAAYNLANDLLALVGSAGWSGLSVGDYADLFGCVDTAGNDLGLDGAWEVANVSSSNLVLRPITGLLGRVSPAPAAGVSLNCGGSVILRTTARIHDLMFEDWRETKVSVDGAGTTRADKALPVVGVGGTMTAAQSTAANLKGQTEGTTAVDGTMPNPVAVGGRASNANIAAMSANGDLAAALMTMIGALVVKPFSIPEADWSYTTGATPITGTADTSIKAAAGTNIKNYLTGLQVQNTHATVGTILYVKDGSTPKFAIYLPPNMAVPIDIELNTPIQSTGNAALNVACLTTGANVHVNAQGYFAP